MDCKLTQAIVSDERDAAKAMTADHPISHNKNLLPTGFTKKGLDLRDSAHRRQAPRVNNYIVQRRLSHTWQHHLPQGLRPIDSWQQWHREGAWLEQAVGPYGSVQSAGHRQSCLVVWLHAIAYHIIRMGSLLKSELIVACRQLRRGVGDELHKPRNQSKFSKSGC